MAVYDVSHYQSAATVAHAIATGAECVFVKATESTSYVDPTHDADVRLIRGARRRVGHYHFASHVANAASEAAYFLAHAGVAVGDVVGLDLEAMDGSWSQRVAYAIAWANIVEHVTGCRVFLYSNTSWRTSLFAAATPAQRADLLARPWWVATGGRPAGQPGVSPWAIHQYSTAGGIDHDVLAPGVVLARYAKPAPVVARPVSPPSTSTQWGRYLEGAPSAKPAWPVDVPGHLGGARKWSGHVWRCWWLIGTRKAPPWPVDIPPRSGAVRQWDGRVWTYRPAP